jgi:hypothetical protein
MGGTESSTVEFTVLQEELERLFSELESIHKQ